MGKKFDINDLKSGYAVETRDGSRFIVTRVQQNRFRKLLVNRERFIVVDSYDNDLTSKSLNKGTDIVKVWGLSDDPLHALCMTDVSERPLLYERPKAKKMTLEDVEKALGYAVEIVPEV